MKGGVDALQNFMLLFSSAISYMRPISEMFSSNAPMSNWRPYTSQIVSREVENQPIFCHTNLTPLTMLILCFLIVHHYHYHCY